MHSMPLPGSLSPSDKYSDQLTALHSRPSCRTWPEGHACWQPTLTHTYSLTHNQRNRHAKIGEKRAEKIKAVQLSASTAREAPRMRMRMWVWMWMWRWISGVVICQSNQLKATASR